MTASPRRVFDKPAHGFDPRYLPAEAAFSALSAYRVLGDKRYLADAVRQLAYAHSRESRNHLVPIPRDVVPSIAEPFTGANAQIRLALGYYVAFKTTRRRVYLDWADAAVSAFLRLPTSEFAFGGRTFNLHHYFYSLREPHQPLSRVDLDPNQQAYVGLVATLFYFEPRSEHFRDAVLRLTAIEQLAAALAPMTPDGRLPLTATRPGEYDTAYGHLALMLSYWANRRWHSPHLDSTLIQALPWVEDFVRTGKSTSFYPVFKEAPAGPYEVFTTLPLVWSYSGDLSAWKRLYARTWLRWRDHARYPGGSATPFVLFELMGVPRSTYW